MANELVALERAFDPLLGHLTQALQVPGVNLTAQRLVRSVLISVERQPDLMQCTRQSLFNAAMSAAVLGLECDGVTGQAFLIRFNVKGTPTAQLVIGYKGYNTLAARSGLTITGEVVREGDAFNFDEGEGWVKHKKLLGAGERRTIAAWAKAAALDRPAVVKVLDIAEILAVRARSPGAKRSDSPWNDEKIGFPAMAEKTVKRRLARSMPLNVMQIAARLDEAVEEQGLAARIDPAVGVITENVAGAEQPSVVELTATPVPPLAEPPGKAAPSTTEKLHAYDKTLTEAARKGTAALETAWWEIPLEYRTSLKSALERRHKVNAAAVDEEGSS